jgi:uncharacterized protein YjbJ (UPF0337 family)
MKWDRIEGDWTELAGNVKRRWSGLVDEQLSLWTGKRDRPKPVAHRQAPSEPPNASPRKHL